MHWYAVGCTGHAGESLQALVPAQPHLGEAKSFVPAWGGAVTVCAMASLQGLLILSSLQIGADAAGLQQYKGELVVSMKYIPSAKPPGAGNGRKGEC